MAYGSFSTNKIQIGRESTAGTAVNATVIWRGPFSHLEDTRNRVIVEEQVGILMNAERSYDSMYGAMLTMPETELTFEHFPHILEAGVMTATPGAATSYSRAYSYPTDGSAPTLKTYTVETVNTTVTGDHREAAYCVVEEFTASGAAGEAWKMSANWFGRQISTGTPTSLTTLATVEEALFPKTKLYIDATGGTVQTTQKTGVLMGAEIKVTTGIVRVPVGDGNLYYTAIKTVKPEITFSITLELESTSGVVAAERAIYESNAVRLFALDCAGSSADKNLNFKWAGKYDSISDYQNTDGNTTVTLDGHAVYSSADSLFWTCTVLNGVASL